MNNLLKLLTLALALTAFSAEASKSPKNGRVDPRIKTVTYNSKDVVKITSHYGYGTHIIFNEDETIENVTIGDSIAWLLAPIDNNIFLKPLEKNADTNLIVLTNKRVYNFELRAKKAKGASDKSLTFQVSFVYPQIELQKQLLRLKAQRNELNKEVIPEKKTSAVDWNFDYSFKGSQETTPVRVFDDGHFTYFQFDKHIDTPAIFQVLDEKKEALVNYHVRGKYIVVERIAGQFILRNGNLATCIFNDTFSSVITPTELKESED